jgi:hypothetical protein
VKHYFVIDVESIGLHGEAYAVAGEVFNELREGGCALQFSCDPSSASGGETDRQWVRENIPPIEVNCATPRTMREAFWRSWIRIKEKFPNIQMAGECVWPVETGFLHQCVRDCPDSRNWDGPYPFMEISSVMQAAGMDPMATYERLPAELPKHDPLADVRQSARLLFTALSKIKL